MSAISEPPGRARGLERVRRRLGRALGDELTRKILGGSLAAFVIKVASAGLSFLMFVALARAMSQADYGVFAFGFSLATFLALVALMGQRTLALRFIPVYEAADAPPGALRGLLIYGYGTVLAAALVIGLGLVLLGPLFFGESAGPPPYLVLSALLVVPMALSDYQSGVYRGMGMVVPALLPRDVMWRIGVILACAPALAGWQTLPFGRGLGAEAALALSGAVLMALILGQFVARPAALRVLLGKEKPVFHGARWRHATLGLWLNDVLQSGAQNIAVVLLGLTLAPSSTGGLFAAIKTAALLSFFLMAANIVVAPQISRMWHAQNLAGLKRVCAVVTLGSSAPTLALFALYAVFGHRILELFGAGYHTAYPSLMVISFAQVVNTLCGQTGILMAMTGNERRLTRFILISNVVPLAAMPVGVMVFGDVFGAVAIAIGMTLWNVQTVFWTRRHLGVDTSILGAVSALRGRG